MAWVVNATPRPLYTWERPGTQCMGGWIRLRASLDGCGKSRPTGIRSPGRTALSVLKYIEYITANYDWLLRVKLHFTSQYKGICISTVELSTAYTRTVGKRKFGKP